MPVLPSDIKFYISGGSANLDPAVSLGGQLGGAEVASAVLGNLFAVVGAAEAAAGSTVYRCIYVGNTNLVDTLEDAEIYFSSTTPSADTAVQMGVDPAGVGDGVATGVATTVATEDIAPGGVVFSEPLSLPFALPLGDLAPGQLIAVWIERAVDLGAAITAMDDCVVRVRGIS